MFMNGTTILSSYTGEAGQNTDVIIEIPENCTSFYLNSNSATNITAKLYQKETIPEYVAEQIGNSEAVINEEINLRTDNENYWRGKKIVWFGTSIPAGVVNAGESGGNGSYPVRVGQMLGATVYNEAVGSSPCRGGNRMAITADDPLGWTGRNWANIGFAFANTISEKQNLIDNWDTWKALLTGSDKPDTLSDARKQDFLNCSYENKLGKYLTGGSVGQVDLYVFDHGHNDTYNGADNAEELCAVPENFNDRTYFIGAMNFLIKTILDDNPRAKICFIGHYENDRKTAVYQAQEKIAELWCFPLCRTWEKIGWTQNVCIVDGATKTMTQAWMPDDLHPASDQTGKALQKYAEVLYPFFRDMR